MFLPWKVFLCQFQALKWNSKRIAGWKQWRKIGLYSTVFFALHCFDPFQKFKTSWKPCSICEVGSLGPVPHLAFGAGSTWPMPLRLECWLGVWKRHCLHVPLKVKHKQTWWICLLKENLFANCQQKALHLVVYRKLLEHVHRNPKPCVSPCTAAVHCLAAIVGTVSAWQLSVEVFTIFSWRKKYELRQTQI